MSDPAKKAGQAQPETKKELMPAQQMSAQILTFGIALRIGEYLQRLGFAERDHQDNHLAGFKL